MTILPPGVEAADEVSVTWERTEDGTKVIVCLGEASITVEASEQGVETLPWLATSLNTILEAAWEAIEAEEEEA